MDIKKLFINNLRFYRCKKNLSQVQLAEMLDLSTSYYNAVENGKYFPSIEVLNSICVQLNLLPFQLFLENPEIDNRKNIELNKLLKLKKEMNNIIDSYCI